VGITAFEKWGEQTSLYICMYANLQPQSENIRKIVAIIDTSIFAFANLTEYVLKIEQWS